MGFYMLRVGLVAYIFIKWTRGQKMFKCLKWNVLIISGSIVNQIPRVLKKVKHVEKEESTFWFLLLICMVCVIKIKGKIGTKLFD